MVNITIIQQKPQNFQERQKRRDRFLCAAMPSHMKQLKEGLPKIIQVRNTNVTWKVNLEI